VFGASLLINLKNEKHDTGGTTSAATDDGNLLEHDAILSGMQYEQ